MIIIKTPATTANLGVGFDSVAMALNLYNVFKIEHSDEFIMNGFEDPMLPYEDHLYYKAYLYLADQYKAKLKPISVTLDDNQIPVSKGLGSSASMILAGMIASNLVHQLNLDDDTITKHAADFEGHPDNIFACMYGGLTFIFKDDQEFVYQSSMFSNRYKMYILVAPHTKDTRLSRARLPKQVPLEDVVFNLSRMSFLRDGLESGDFELLKKIAKDKLHQPYRFESLIDSKDYSLLNEMENCIVLISGAGPSLFIISKNKPTFPESIKSVYQIKEVMMASGTSVEGVL